MKMSEYLNRTHTLGRIANIVAMAVMLGIPAIVCTVYDIWPTVSSIIATAGPLLAMFIPSALSEVISFTPITGSSGYVGAIMGNVSNIKFPCAMSAMERTAGAYVIQGKMKLSLTILVLMMALFLIFPALIPQQGYVLMFSIPVVILIARVFYQKGIVTVTER